MAVMDTSRAIALPARVAFDSALADLCDMTGWMPNIAAIEFIDRRREAGREVRLDRWKAQADGWIRHVVPNGLASWVVRSWWDAEQRRIDWDLVEVDAPVDVASTGTIRIDERPVGAMVAIAGNLHVLRTPRLVRRSWVEPRLMTLLEHNLLSFFDGVQRATAA